MEKDKKFFFRFLKEHSIYKTFFNEVKRNKCKSSTLNDYYNGDIKKLIDEEDSRCIIDRALDWHSSILGWCFWNKKDKEYRSYYDENFINYLANEKNK